MTDLISRADAIDAVRKVVLDAEAIEALKALPSADAVDVAHDIPEYCSWSQTYTNMVQSAMADTKSADAEPTVIRAKTFMRKEDFDKWAEDIKKQNKSIVCIPCDAEVVSADAVQGEWIQISPAKIYECSVCHHNVLTDYIDTYNFCPSCGARMKGGDDE